MSEVLPIWLSLFDVVGLWAKGKEYALEGLTLKIRCSGWNDMCYSGSQLNDRLSLLPQCHSRPERATQQVPGS